MRRLLSWMIVTTIVVAGPAVAAAQANPEAEQLFRDGKRLMGEQRLAEACDAFATSQRIEPHIATLLSLADCREKHGELATAWALFLEAERETRNVANQADLHATADGRAAALEPRLSYLTINVPDESRVEDLHVTRNGVAIDPGLWNRAVPVDGGDHVIEGKAPGHEPWSTRVTVGAEQDRQAVEVPRFKELPALVSAQQPPAASGPGAAALAAKAPVARDTGMSGRRRVALIGGGLGLATVATGLVLGAGASGMYDDAVDTCPPAYCTNTQAAEAQALHDRARDRAVIANVTMGVGAVALAAGAYLWFTDRPREQRVAIAPQVGGGVTGVALGGRF